MKKKTMGQWDKRQTDELVTTEETMNSQKL